MTIESRVQQTKERLENKRTLARTSMNLVLAGASMETNYDARTPNLQNDNGIVR